MALQKEEDRGDKDDGGGNEEDEQLRRDTAGTGVLACVWVVPG